MALHVDKQTYFWSVTPMCKTPKKQLEDLNVILNGYTSRDIHVHSLMYLKDVES